MKTKDVYSSSSYPVTVRDMKITAHIAFHEALGQKPERSDKTYAEIAAEGIRRYWSEAGFEVELIPCKIKDKTPHVNVLPAKVTGTSYVMSRWWRWGWGPLRCALHPESFMLNWSLKNPGNIHLNLRTYRSESSFMRIAAHEFGHILGLGDAYAAHYRYFYEAPGTKTYMMNRNERVSEEEVAMVLKAHRTGKMQYFPMKFSLKRYVNGLRKHR
ncbi:MAG: hypothetical protein J6127_05375 [Clostridiales bacterium]|nr:hypothetical protein [Clostridiales bacterium]